MYIIYTVTSCDYSLYKETAERGNPAHYAAGVTNRESFVPGNTFLSETTPTFSHKVNPFFEEYN